MAPARRTMALVGGGAAALARGAALAREAGLDVVGEWLVAGTADLPDAAFAADLLFVEVDADPGPVYDVLLARAGRLAHGGQATIVAIRSELIDITDAGLAGAPVTTLCGAAAGERLAEVELALAAGAARLREEAPDREDRLRAISTDLSRIAERLVDAVAPGQVQPDALPALPAPSGEAPAVEADAFRRILRRRRLRDLYLGDGLFSDPAWDMLLDLAAARLEETSVAVSSLCIAAAVPNTTALRWIRVLTERGLVVRTPDPGDGRRVFVTLSPETARAMSAYVQAVRQRDAA